MCTHLNSELEAVIVNVQNLGVQKNCEIRKEVKLGKRWYGETEQEMIDYCQNLSV